MIKRIVGVARFVGGKVKFLCEMSDGSLAEKFISEVVSALYGSI